MKTILSIICLLSFATVLSAQKAGTLDKSFGDTGVVTNSSIGCDAIAIQSDQKLIIGSSYQNNLAVSRINTNGTTDISFGNKGIATANLHVAVTKLAVTSNGNIIAGGGSQNLSLVSFKPNGQIDSTFGTNGVSTVDFGEYEYFEDMQLQADGKIVVAGISIQDLNNPDAHMLIARFNSNGTLDDTFGNNGSVINSYEIDDRFASNVVSIAIQPDGKILIGGSTFSGGSNDNFLIVSYNSNGSLDSSFGTSGSVITQYSTHNDYLFSLCVNANGKILAGGEGNYNLFGTTPGNMLLMQYNSNGSLDTSFGSKGSVAINFGSNNNSEIKNILIQDRGKVVVAGNLADEDGTYDYYALARVSSTGVLDSSFAVNGEQITAIGTYDYALGAVLYTNGKIALGGNAFLNSTYNAALARYNNDGTTIIRKIKHYIQNHNNLESNSTAEAKAATLNIGIAPNPVNNMLTIKGLSVSAKYAVRITNENGNTIANKQINNVSSYQINVQSLSAGVYYVNITSNNNQSTTLKFIKQ